ncbi:MAG: hypothetical protein GY899_12840 [Verrucomicrobiaceae bacterium]|nr:hypothetical protein [Verrucomicrobiaceae bacterium]
MLLPEALDVSSGLYPRGDRDRLFRFESGIVWYLDGVRTTIEDQCLTEFTVSVVASCSRIGWLRGASDRNEEKTATFSFSAFMLLPWM